MTENEAAIVNQGLPGTLTRTRLSMRAVIVIERLWPLLLPLVIVAGMFLAVSWFGIFRLVPDAVRLALTILFALAGLAALYPLRLLRRPTADEIDRRIERVNQLAHTPVLVQSDRPSGKDDAFSQALWREHQKRMAEKLGTVGGDMPRPGIPERDPWGLRGLVALLLVTAFSFSFGPIGGTIHDAFHAHSSAEIIPPRVDAWVTPPTYTGKAPVFLTADTNRETAFFTVPEGSDLSVRITGGSGKETLSFSDSGGVVREIGATSPAGAPKSPSTAPHARQFSDKLASDGVLTLKSGETDLGSWSFAVTPDKAPVIRFSGDPKRAVNGALELNYEIEDDYGASAAVAGFALADPQPAGARPLYGPPEMALSLPRRGANAVAAKTSKDLTEHVWAGSNIALTLTAEDAAGHKARSETKTIVLPERPFSNPLARAVIEQRRLLALDANAKPRVLALMDAITLRPEDTFDNMSHYLGIVSAQTRLRLASSDDQLRDVVAYLWDIALGIEQGDLSAAEKRLQQAQEALKQALENGASDAEIEKLMAELRKAMDEFLREFAERAQQNPSMSQQMPKPGQELRESDLKRMMDQIENLAKSGNRDKAKEMLSQLQEMMNNLQAGRQQKQDPNGQQNSEMRQQMDKLGEIMRRQQEMMNETFRMDQMQRGQRQRGQDRSEQQGEQGEQGAQPGDQPGDGMSPKEFADALKQLQEGQGKLQGDLEALQKGLEGLGLQPGEGFGEAGDAMGKAKGALGKGEGEQAVGEQGRALEALRKGAQDMMQQMQQAQQGEEGGSEEGGRRQNADRDPLGRPRATTGPDFGNSVKVPDEIDVQRARQILEAIRKRLGNALSPDLERSYLERLLELK